MFKFGLLLIHPRIKRRDVRNRTATFELAVIIMNIIRLYFAFFRSFYPEPTPMCAACREPIRISIFKEWEPIRGCHYSPIIRMQQHKIGSARLIRRIKTG